MKLNKVLKIMRHVLEKPAEETEDSLKEKFGKGNYYNFSRYCLGGHQAFAQELASKKIRLTQLGIREYHRLNGERLQRWFNISMFIATSLLAIFTGILAFRA